MNESELKNVWQAYDKKLNKLIEINSKQLRSVKSEKAESKIRSFLKVHILVMVLGIVWVAFLGFVLYHYHTNIYFTVSVGLILLFNVFAVALYLQHIIILSQINIAGSILETQHKLIKVYTSYNDVGRILLLQTPLYCTFWISDELIKNGGPLFWSIQFIVVSLFTALSIYLYIKLSPNNSSKKWVNFSDKFFGAEKLQKAISFLHEIEEFEKEEKLKA